MQAAPGWGKTTAASYLVDEHQAAWYAVDELDRDPVYLAQGLARALQVEVGPAESDLPLLAARLAAAVPEGGATLVVDDAHHLGESDGARLLPLVIAAGTGRLHLVLLSSVPLAALDGKLQRTAARIDAPHLELDLDAAVRAAPFLGAVGEPMVRRVLQVTGGWPALVGLACRELESLGHVTAEDLDALGAAEGPIGRFLSDEVVPQLPEPWLRRCAKLALLGAIDATTLADVVGVAPSRAGRDLAELLSMGLARKVDRGRDVEPIPALAHLLLDEVIPRRDDLPELLEELVEGLRGVGAVDRAIDVLGRIEAAGSKEELADLLRQHGHDVFRRRGTRPVTRACAKLPASLRDPSIELVHGHALLGLGRWSEALHCFEAAGVDRQGPLRSELAMALGQLHHFRGELASALEAYARGPEQDDGGADFVAYTSWYATALWLRGDIEAARRRAEVAMASAKDRVDDRSLAYAHTIHALLAASDGDRRANEAHHRQALTAAERCDDRIQQTRIRVNRGSHHLEQGGYAQALAETDRAIELGTEVQVVPMLAVAHANRAEILLRTGALDLAIADAEAAIELFEAIGSRNVSYGLRLLGDIRRERGDLALARQAYGRAIELAGPAGDVQGVVPALLGLALAAVRTAPEQAEGYLAEARDRADTIRGVDTLLASAWVALARRDVAQAATYLDQVEQAAANRYDQRGQAEAATLRALLSEDPLPGLRDARELWRQLADPIWSARVGLGIATRSGDATERSRAETFRRELQRIGCPLDGGSYVHQLVVGGAGTEGVTIRALGGFSVDHDGRPLAVSAWGSRKARDLLKLLVVRAGRGVAREELAHALWPDEAYSDVSNRLSVALSVVRGVLVPDGEDPKGAPLVTDGSTVRLETEGLVLDVDRFSAAARAGLQAAREDRLDEARALLGDAEATYAGDLLEDDRDLPWAEDRRAELRATYLAVTRTLAQLQADDPDIAVPLLLRVIDRDPYDEAAHLEVCRILLQGGRHGEARRHHERYAQRMGELDLPARTFDEIAGTRPRDRTSE